MRRAIPVMASYGFILLSNFNHPREKHQVQIFSQKNNSCSESYRKYTYMYMYIKASTLMLHNIRGAPICTKRSLFCLGVGTMYLTAKSSYMYVAKAILKHDNHIVHRDSRLLRS